MTVVFLEVGGIGRTRRSRLCMYDIVAAQELIGLLLLGFGRPGKKRRVLITTHMVEILFKRFRQGVGPLFNTWTELNFLKSELLSSSLKKGA